MKGNLTGEILLIFSFDVQNFYPISVHRWKLFKIWLGITIGFSGTLVKDYTYSHFIPFYANVKLLKT